MLIELSIKNPNGVRRRKLTLLAVQSNRRDTVFGEIGSTIGLRAGLPFRKMLKTGEKKSTSLQVYCPND